MFPEPNELIWQQACIWAASSLAGQLRAAGVAAWYGVLAGTQYTGPHIEDLIQRTYASSPTQYTIL